MRNLKMVVQYDGTDFAGWQIQPGRPTIQGRLTEVLGRIDGGPVTIDGSGRTDAGVHALGQVASSHTDKPMALDELQRALNGHLPAAIRVMQLEEVEERFHARRNARLKHYRYQIFLGAVVSPFIHRYVWHSPRPLDLAGMNEGARLLTGEHDFASFACGAERAGSTIRRIESAHWSVEGELVSFTIAGDGFLRSMVRRLSSGLYALGRGKLELRDFADLLDRPRPNNLTPSLPARGLTLMKVDY
ncbi:MAG: tRNA pseudouridine(38-40) synthase TruA [Acidobacteria bacterium]|nr:tRNA pseudouridine(38-40) synthase TruA [Acidobacteriota bacterium]